MYINFWPTQKEVVCTLFIATYPEVSGVTGSPKFPEIGIIRFWKGFRRTILKLLKQLL